MSSVERGIAQCENGEFQGVLRRETKFEGGNRVEYSWNKYGNGSLP